MATLPDRNAGVYPFGTDTTETLTAIRKAITALDAALEEATAEQDDALPGMSKPKAAADHGIFGGRMISDLTAAADLLNRYRKTKKES